MLEAIAIISALSILAILFWPRRSPYVRNVTSTRNGQSRWHDQESY